MPLNLNVRPLHEEQDATLLNRKYAVTHLQLTTLDCADAQELLDFECENRSFFESQINSRASDYYCRDGVLSAIEIAETEAREDKAYQYLIRSASGVIVGRVNLTRVRRAHFHSAELGYRVAESARGQGYAITAVSEVLRKAFGELNLWRVEAAASAENISSITVLKRSGFVQFGHSRRSFELAGRWHDRLYFEKHADT